MYQPPLKPLNGPKSCGYFDFDSAPLEPLQKREGAKQFGLDPPKLVGIPIRNTAFICSDETSADIIYCSNHSLEQYFTTEYCRAPFE